ncbi:MAG TPA: 1,4-alpha-glucan branching protein GlgB [Terriglobales bacterium]|nr:1,4-alpha-glucan branching protein GlgB [Candidatus Sulfotelmatobacter sp.]HYW36507.1 1,4-alpha-glucan branching protein GlgB [Terriglobales bacterium]
MSPESTTASPQLLTDQDLYLFNEGSNYRMHDKMGAHPFTHNGQAGTVFSVWAPNARSVSVVGSFNGWDPKTHRLEPRGSSGIWEGFVPGASRGALYKFHIESQRHGFRVDKADPVGLLHEKPPRTASVIWDLDYQWGDQDWMGKRAGHNSLRAPQAIYEVHLGSWMRVPEEHNRPLTYRETAPRLAEYMGRMGFTHVEFLPVMEHPFYGSWGYQTTGYFAPTSRYGTPQDFMYLVDYLHQHGIGVILDWVPSHFPSDGHGLAYFDGTHLYEHADSRQGFHPDWKTHIFNYGRPEVRSFLMSSAMFWLDKYHIDGLRVDAVASMLYLDYSRKQGEWIPNKYGGRENLDAIEFLRRFNQEAYKEHPEIQTTAEESTSWPMVSKPIYLGGLGFGMKWDMGWMHDTLKYFQNDPIHRKFHHSQLTFRMLYSWHENFVLPLSHDEVVHGKGSLIGKMPGDEWQRFANLRLLFGYMYAQPGKKLLFMGGEFGQVREWGHDTSLEWHVTQFPFHRGMQAWMEQLNRLYRGEPAMHVFDNDPAGFEWVDCNDNAASTISLLRKSEKVEDTVLVVCNFTPVPRTGYRVGVPFGGHWRELLNSDAREYGGSGLGNLGGVQAEAETAHGRPYSLKLTLPPLTALFFKAS